MEDSKAGLSIDLAELWRLKDEVGRMPPMPPTKRGRVGALLVSVVRRALFWVWPPLHAFFDVLCRMLERLAHAFEELSEKIRSLDVRRDTAQSIEMELADIRAHRDHMDEAQAELWLEVTKLKAQIAEIRSTELKQDVAPLR